MQNVYFISGLGATKRSFQFLDLSFCNPVFLDWIPPQLKESLHSYAMRLRSYIPEKNPVIVGLSFGGMLASEMAREEQGIHAIIISSNKTSEEFPGYLRTGKYLPVYRMIPAAITKRLKHLLQFMLGAKGQEQKSVQRLILQESDIAFTNAAIDMIMHWKTTAAPGNVTHIHGTADRLLPYRRVKADFTVPGGTHLMVMNQAKEVSEILKTILVDNSTR